MFIAVTGPESSGKTTMSEYLGHQLPARVVEEHARRYLNDLGRAYGLEDIVEIGRIQYREVAGALDRGEPAVVSDTFMLELKVWTEVRYEGEPGLIRELRTSLVPDIYVLCRPDLPWEEDPLRENPDDRDDLYHFYKSYAHASGAHCVEAYGEGSGRMERVVEAIRHLM